MHAAWQGNGGSGGSAASKPTFTRRAQRRCVRARLRCVHCDTCMCPLSHGGTKGCLLYGFTGVCRGRWGLHCKVVSQLHELTSLTTHSRQSELHDTSSSGATCRRRLTVLALLFIPGVLLYGLYTAAWQWPWGGEARTERQSVQVSTSGRHNLLRPLKLCQH